MEEYDDEQDARVTDLAGRQPELALGLAKDLVARFPATGRSWNKLAHAHAMANGHTDALSAMKRAVELDPDEPAYQFNVSRMHMKVGEFCDAVDALSRCIELSDSLQNDYYVEASYLYRAHCYLKLGRLVDAERDLERVTDDARLWMDGLLSKADMLEACRQRKRG
jgi:tetratricopeptide (TPR) repeat protein